MNEEVSSTETSAVVALAPEPLEKDHKQRILTETTSEHTKDDCYLSKSHSLTSGFEKKAQTVLKPPPTAMVAPTVSSTNNRVHHHHSSSAGTSPTRSPKISRRGLDRNNYGLETTLSTPSLNRVHDKATFGAGHSKSERQIQSLMKSLSERSQIIERQKMTITRLQTECREKETLLRKLRLENSQELIVTDPTDITSSSTTAVSAPVKIDMLSRKLDSLYYELDKNKEEHQATSNKLHEQVNQSTELKVQLEESQSRVKELEQKIEKLQDYLGNTPTMEEHYGMKDEITSLSAECQVLKGQVKDRDQLVAQLREKNITSEQMLQEKSMELSDLNMKYSELGVTANSLDIRLQQSHNENASLKLDIQNLQESAKLFDQRLRDELAAMRERHHVRFRDATAKLRDQHKEVVKRNKMLEKQLLKSSDAMAELNTELTLKQGIVGELKSSVDTLVHENQGLLQQNLALQVSHAETVRSAQSSPDNGMTLRLIQEIASCVDDFSSLVNLLSSMIEGHDPTGSLLLGGGSKNISESVITSIHGLSVDSELQKHLEHLRKLHDEIERLRTVVTERYADQIATDCTVQ